MVPEDSLGWVHTCNVTAYRTTTLDGYQWSNSRPGHFTSEERTHIPIGNEAIATKFATFPQYIFFEDANMA